MKKLILSALLTTCAVAVYAGESCEGSFCCAKTKTSMQTTSSTCCKSKMVTKATKHKSATAKETLQSPKAMSLASR